MKILHLSTSDLEGGAARAAYRLHQGLLGIGEQSRMLVRYKRSTDSSVIGVPPGSQPEESDEDVRLAAAIQAHYINSHRTNISNTIFSFPYPAYDLSTCRLVKEADILNLHWVAQYQSPFTLRNLFALDKPVVWTLHDQWAFTGGCHYSAGCDNYADNCANCPQLDEDPFRLPEALLRDKVSLFKGSSLTIVTPSRWLGACARKSRLFRHQPVEVVAYGLDTDVFTPLPKPQAKKSLGLSGDTVAILLVAHQLAEKRKGLDQVVLALQYCMENTEFRALAERSKMTLLCLGLGGERLLHLGIPAVSLGYADSDQEICTIYAAADMFLLPSLEDNLPNTMLEAMSCGTPVVAYTVGGVPEVVIADVTGKLLPAGDPRGLADAILSLAFNADQASEMAKNCRNMMVQGYSLPVQARRYLGLYEQLRRDHMIAPPSGSQSSEGRLDRLRWVGEQPALGIMTVPLETAVGPHFSAIYDQILLRALREATPVLWDTKDRLQAENRDLRLQLTGLRGSRSWRVTKPLRAVARFLANLRR